MQLYNTLSRSVEELKPLQPPIVRVYSCGPTVYDYPHIGNWFSFIRYDLLIRSLIANNYQPKWVMNITDVGHLTSDEDEGDDKVQRAANKHRQTAWQLADKYTTYFIDSLSKLNFIQPNALPRATTEINHQIDLITKLVNLGYTYTIDGDGLYFDTAKFSDYGKLAELDLNQPKKARIIESSAKHQPSDFALWKFSPKNLKRDMEWPSPWGVGFPGWHIECSAMALNYLGPTLDIHAGGIDHIPVHHTNEIAQSETANNQPLAKIWFHTNHILIDGQKISKSLGNGILLEDLLAKGYTLNAFRLLVAESHYRSQSQFSWQILDAAQHRLNRLANILNYHYANNVSSSNISLPPTILASLSDDLNVNQALNQLDDFLSRLSLSQLSAKTVQLILQAFNDYFGIKLQLKDIDDQAKNLILKRNDLRRQKQFAEADQIRQELLNQQIILEDLADLTLWTRNINY